MKPLFYKGLAPSTITVIYEYSINIILFTLQLHYI